VSALQNVEKYMPVLLGRQGGKPAEHVSAMPLDHMPGSQLLGSLACSAGSSFGGFISLPEN
jgi:hypothetical protein